jgi:hypothetical protein
MKYTTINMQSHLRSNEMLRKVETAYASGQQATDFALGIFRSMLTP